MTTPERDPEAAIVRAAQELEAELKHCEEAVADAARLRLNTEKNIGKAARALQKANEHREQTAARVVALQSAIQAAYGRAEAATLRMAERATELQGRLQLFQAFQARGEEIAAVVREVTEFAKGAKDPREVVERLTGVEDRVAAVQAEARAADFDDVAHEMAGLKDVVATLRRKLEGPPR